MQDVEGHMLEDIRKMQGHDALSLFPEGGFGMLHSTQLASSVTIFISRGDRSRDSLNQGRPKHNHNHNFPKQFCIRCHIKTAFDDTSDENISVFFVFHCVERAFGAASGVTPKTKNGAPRDELKNGRGRGWAVAYLRNFEASSSLDILREF